MGFEYDPEELENEARKTRLQKTALSSLGDAVNSLTSRRSAAEILLNQPVQKSTAGDSLKTFAQNMEDPWERQKKTYENYISAKNAGKLEREDAEYSEKKDPNSKSSKALRLLAPRWGIAVTDDMSAHDIEKMIDPRKMMETEAIRAADNAEWDRRFSKESAEKARARAAEAAAKENGRTEGTKAMDKDYAKEYNDWVSSGKSTVEKNLERLRNAKKVLESETGADYSGGFVGLVPDKLRKITNPNAIATRDDVRAAAQGALKATLGAQFTEKEGERIMNQAYDEQLPPAENAKRIQAAIDELTKNQGVNDSRARFWEQNKTLNGFEMDRARPVLAGTNEGKKIKKTQTNQKTGEKRVIYEDGSTEIIPGNATASR
jgi:hypothetical protein